MQLTLSVVPRSKFPALPRSHCPAYPHPGRPACRWFRLLFTFTLLAGAGAPAALRDDPRLTVAALPPSRGSDPKG